MLYYQFGVSDKFGYYEVGQKKFYSKVEAIAEMTRTGIHLEYRFHDDALRRHDWTTEPIESLEELYRQRCQQLRDRYEYLVVTYSGGSDSHNMLDMFIKNEIWPDEIMIYHNWSVNSDELMTNGEVKHVAYPYAKKIVEKYPWIKLRMIDIAKPTYELFSSSPDRDMIVHTNWATFSPGSCAVHMTHQLDNDYLDMIGRGVNLGFVFGFDKPRVWQVDGKYCHRFMDISNGVAVIGSNMPTEMFYFHPDAAKMLIKQCHVIKRYMERATPDSPFITTKNTGRACKDYMGKKLWLTDDGCHTLLYSTWDIRTFSAGKDPSKILSKRDRWFLKNPNDPARIAWHNLVMHWWNQIPEYWQNRPGNIAGGAKMSYTQPYFLER